MVRLAMMARMCAGLLAAGAAGSVRAQDDGRPDPAQAALIDQLTAAINARDADAVRALHHAEAFACVNARNRDAAEATLTAPFAFTIPDDYQAAVYPTTGADGPDWMHQLYRTAVPFTHQLQIHFTVDGHSAVITNQMVEIDGAWQLVLLCLSDLGVEWYELAKSDPEKAREMARQWAAEQAAE